MPSEQLNENMDKVLKAYAQKRREDSVQMDLDLPTRRMLQAEVSRTFRKVPVQAQSRPRFVLWPQLIMGVACAAALAIAILLWKLPAESTLKVNAGRSAEYHDLTAVNPAAPATDLGAVEAAKPAPSVVLEKKSADQPLSFSAKAEAPRNESTLTVTGAQPDAGVADSSRFKDDVDGRDSNVTRAPAKVSVENRAQPPVGSTASPVAAPAATTASLAASSASPPQQNEPQVLAGELVVNKQVAQAAQSRMQFSQIDNRAQYRRNLNSPPLPKVLTNFNVERNGSNVLVRDADGSTYTGKIVALNGVEQSKAGQLGMVNGGAIGKNISQNGEGTAQDTFAFRVSGYNSRLRQKVVFTGSVTNSLVTTNAIVLNATQQSAAPSQNSQNANGQQALQQNAQNVLLNGRVQIGRGSEFDIEAAPTK
jgi:hypothetical protein